MNLPLQIDLMAHVSLLKPEFEQVNSSQVLINSISTQINLCTEDTLLFYNLKDSKQAQTSFNERMQNCLSKNIIVSSVPWKIPADRNVFVMSVDKFMQAKITFSNLIYPLKKEPTYIGITGTNGKTTTAYLLNQLLTSMGEESLYIGTLGAYKGKSKVAANFETTTPDYIELRACIFGLGKIDYCILEASSHALEQNRLKGIKFIAAGWTNISQDHLDYHGNMENYLAAKLKITNLLYPDGKLVVAPEQGELFENVKLKYTNTIQSKKEIITGTEYPLFLHYQYNQENLSLAVEIIGILGLQIKPENISDLTAPPGRLESFEIDGRFIFIDYAHTPDALNRLLLETKKAFPGKFISVVFGCGGNRDRSKRPIMGKVVENNSNAMIVTSDNPRDEDPNAIIDDIVNGITSSNKVLIEPDRRNAIIKAFSNSPINSIIIIAGKGHENYQEIAGLKHTFDDKEIVKSLKELT